MSSVLMYLLFNYVAFSLNFSIPFKTPTVNGVEIDLYHFYTLVQQRGGLSKVCTPQLYSIFFNKCHNVKVFKINLTYLIKRSNFGI